MLPCKIKATSQDGGDEQVG